MASDALIVVTCMVLDFLAHLPSLGFTAKEQEGWSWASTIAMLAVGFAFYATTTVTVSRSKPEPRPDNGEERL